MFFVAAQNDFAAPADHKTFQKPDTEALLNRLVTLRRHAQLCVLWKTNNIGLRLTGDSHHPSSKGAWHDHLNTFAAALAATHSVPVIDPTPVTLKANMTAVTQKPNAPTGATPFDMYHNYDAEKMWAYTERRIVDECLRS